MSDDYGLLIDHVHLRVRDIAASRKFYEAAVAALGLAITWESDYAVEIRELFLSADQPPSGPSGEGLAASSTASTPSETRP